MGPDRAVHRDGVLVSPLETTVIDGVERTQRPEKHVAYWIGQHPHHSDGRKITNFENPSPAQNLGEGVHVNHCFSAKAEYRDYCHKMLAYLGWIVGEAQKLDPDAKPTTHPIYPSEDEDDVFHYLDTASSRVMIGSDNDKLRDFKIAIVGVGGTGSYVLDFLAKTRVKEIHLFDADRFEPHNAFRTPGAWSIEELGHHQSKVDALISVYSKLRRKGLIGHEEFLTESNVVQLEGIDFAFLCLDSGESKRAVVDWLVDNRVPFIDVGMGVTRGPSGLQGIIRVVTATPEKANHVDKHISFGAAEEAENEYATNIQIAELNALNASLAVIKWKRFVGFYRDAGREHYTGYQIVTGEIVNDEIIE